MHPTITVDIGTTSIKLCYFDADAVLVTSDRMRTPTVADGSGDIYDLDELNQIVAAFIVGLGPIRRRSVERVSITGVGESGGLVNHDLTLASPMILWHDQRGAAYLEALTPQDRARIYRITGLPVNGNYGISKAAWALRRAGRSMTGAKWLNVAEYLAALMTGERWAEPSLASRTMALDLISGSWSSEVCALFDVDPSVFPDLRRAADGAPIARSYAAETGLPPSATIHVAGHDHMVGGFGAGLRTGELLNSTGTTEGLLFLRRAPDLGEQAESSKLANGLDTAGTGFTLFASIPTGGAAFAALQHLLGIDATGLNASIRAIYAQYVAGEIDLGHVPLVAPRFRGSPPPTKDHSARGLIAGLQTETSMEQIIFGCFLGMTLQFRDVLDLFQLPTDRVKVIGPASENPLWQQLKADLLGTPLSASRVSEVVSRGAQALASNAELSWEASNPVEVSADPTRHLQLREWSDEIAPQWEYLKGYPS